MSLRLRLVLVLLAVAVGGAWPLVSWLADDLRRRYLEATEEGMVDAANILAALVSQRMTEGGDAAAVDALRAAFADVAGRELRAHIYDLVKTRVDIHVEVTDARGLVIFSSDGSSDGRDHSRWRDVILTLRGEYGARTTRIDPDDARTAVLHVAAPVVSVGRIVGVLTVIKPTDSVSFFVELAQQRITAAVVWFAAIAALLGVLATMWVTVPITRLTDWANALRTGRRVAPPPGGPREIADLRAAFADLLEAVEGKRHAERYVQNLAHEMKSPLSGIRASAELLREDLPPAERARFLAGVLGETARLQSLLDLQLQLAALEGRVELREREPIDLGTLVEEVVTMLRPQAEVRQLATVAVAIQPAKVIGERFLLRQALINLVQNAIEFSSAGGEVRIETAVRDGMAEVTVLDRGPGVPEYALGKVFERFFSLPRPDTGTRSSGLGLTFVREAAALHGGTASLVNRRDGGARAAITLPAAG
ncbi:MAG: two-component system sensor histidine kinase CreC [Planctomycetes bacterium]|nr:two-component system sensor histidine kinase CreC [Planctomycetota bacterium]